MTSGFGIEDILGDLGNIGAIAQPADKDGRIVCAGCGTGHPHVTDLRPWPPETGRLRYCGECRLKKALGK